MLAKFRKPYRLTPVWISVKRIDVALEQGAQAEIQSPGRRGSGSTSIITLRRPDGTIADQWTLQGNVRMGHRFVVAYNRKLSGFLQPPRR